jgi:hypothetical protein
VSGAAAISGPARWRALALILLLLGASRLFMHLPLPSPAYGFELYDLGHRWVPALHRLFPQPAAGWIWWFGAASLALVFTAVLAAILWRGAGARLGVALALATTAHSLFWHATILPIPDDLVWRFPLYTGETPEPNDFWFSGHTALAALYALAAGGRAVWVRVCAWAYLAFIVFLVLSARAHYSIDVIGAFFVSYAMYRLAGRLLATRLLNPQGAARGRAAGEGGLG